MNIQKNIFALLVLISLTNTISGYDTKEFSSKEMHDEFIQRYGDYKFYIYRMCYAFDLNIHHIEPSFYEEVDRNYWYELCFNFRNYKDYYKNFIMKERARILKEVKAEFEKKDATKSES